MRMLPVAVLAILLLGGCSTTPSTEPAAAGASLTDQSIARSLVAGDEWRLVSAVDAGGKRIGDIFAGKSAFILRFADRLAIRGGCNSMSAPWRVEQLSLVVGDLQATRMACEGGLLEADAALSKRLVFPLRIAMPNLQSTRITLTTRGGDVLALERTSTPVAQ